MYAGRKANTHTHTEVIPYKLQLCFVAHDKENKLVGQIINFN